MKMLVRDGVVVGTTPNIHETWPGRKCQHGSSGLSVGRGAKLGGPPMPGDRGSLSCKGTFGNTLGSVSSSSISALVIGVNGDVEALSDTFMFA